MLEQQQVDYVEKAYITEKQDYEDSSDKPTLGDFTDADVNDIEVKHETMDEHIIDESHLKEGIKVTSSLPLGIEIDKIDRQKILDKSKQGDMLKCEQCHFETRASSSRAKRRLMAHVKALHHNIRDFKCKHCEYAAAEKTNLKRFTK